MPTFPNHYFRTTETGATAFRVVFADGAKRAKLTPIANINLHKGIVKPRGKTEMTEQDREAISSWMDSRQARRMARTIEDLHRLIEQMNLTIEWATSSATEEEFDIVAPEILLAAQDLTTILTRQIAAREQTVREAENASLASGILQADSRQGTAPETVHQ